MSSGSTATDRQKKNRQRAKGLPRIEVHIKLILASKGNSRNARVEGRVLRFSAQVKFDVTRKQIRFDH